MPTGGASEHESQHRSSWDEKGGVVGVRHKSLGCKERTGNDRPRRLVLLKMLCLLLYSMTTSGL